MDFNPVEKHLFMLVTINREKYIDIVSYLKPNW